MRIAIDPGARGVAVGGETAGGAEMKLAYVAGPFRAANAWEIELNIRRAETVALELWRMGFATICPHTNSRFFQGAAPDDVWLRGDLEILRRCDFVVLVPGWQKSSGTAGEVAEAQRRGIPVFVFQNDGNLIRQMAGGAE